MRLSSITQQYIKKSRTEGNVYHISYLLVLIIGITASFLIYSNYIYDDLYGSNIENNLDILIINIFKYCKC